MVAAVVGLVVGVSHEAFWLIVGRYGVSLVVGLLVAASVVVVVVVPLVVVT